MIGVRLQNDASFFFRWFSEYQESSLINEEVAAKINLVPMMLLLIIHLIYPSQTLLGGRKFWPRDAPC